MEDWTVATWISAIALAISLLSFAAAVWVAWISHKTLTHARESHDTEMQLVFERERTQLLDLVTQDKAHLRNAQQRIGAVKARFDAAPPPAQALLVNYTQLFTEMLPRIDDAIRQCDVLWDNINSWTLSEGAGKMINSQARYRSLLHENQVAQEHASYMAGVFGEKLDMALTHISGSPRG